MEYTLETATRLAEELRALPAKDPSQRRLDKQAMVKHLSQEITALQERGYTIEEVAESLRGHGLEITTPTLKNYLQRAKGVAEKSRRARRPAGQPRSGAKAGQATRASAVPASPAVEAGPKPAATSAKAEAPPGPAPEPALRTGKGAFLIKDKESY